MMEEEHTHPNAATRLLLAFAADPNSHGEGLKLDGADVTRSGIGDDVESHPAWNNDTDGLDLSGRNLMNSSLRRANLARVNLAGSDASSVDGSGLNLTSASLEGASLVSADLIGAIFTGANGGEANFSKALLEDAKFESCSLRFANFSESILDGADFSSADLWGARLDNATAERAVMVNVRLDESYMNAVELTGANLHKASLRRAKLPKAVLRDTDLREATFDGADLSGADLRRATLPNVSLATATLTHVSFAGAWLDRTRMRAAALGGMVGEEVQGDLPGAVDSYLVLEGNFRSLGMREDESWCYRRRRRVQKRIHRRQCLDAFKQRHFTAAFAAGARFVADEGAEWLCDYGDSLVRVLRSMVVVLVLFALVYWLTGSLTTRIGAPGTRNYAWINYLLFSLDSMTTVGTSEVPLRPASEFGVFVSSLQTAIGTMLLGLFGFVLGGRIRN